MITTIQIRRDTAANWTSVNPVLHQGEWALETDTAKVKIGDGNTVWSSLAYFAPSLSGYAPLASPAFTGTPTAPTPTAGDYSTRLATTAFVTRPYQFFPEQYGAKGNGKAVTDAATTNGSNILTCATSQPFTSADVGKAIIVTGAGTSGFPLVTTIAGFTDAAHVTLATVALTTVAAQGIIYGTDDTAAIQNCINAAVAYAQANYGLCEVVFSQAYYIIAGAPVLGGATLGNGQIMIPSINASTGIKVNLKLSGAGAISAAPEHWLGTQINAPGSVLVTINNTGTYSSLYGPAAQICGPVNGYGGGGGTFSNMQIVVDGITTLGQWQGNIGGLNFYGIGQADLRHYSYMPIGVTTTGGAWPHIFTGGPTNNQFTAGYITPATGNNALNDVGSYTCYGMYIALSGSDHLTVQSMRSVFNGVGWNPSCAGGEAHGASIQNFCCEATSAPIGAFESGVTWGGYATSGYVPMNVMALDLESYASYIVSGDVNNLLTGVVYFETLKAASLGINQPWYGGAQQDHVTVKIMSLESVPGIVASPQTVPGSTTAFQNWYFRDAMVLISGGTVSAIAVDGVTLGVTSGWIPVPSGHTITLTYSAAPSWKWMLL